MRHRKKRSKLSMMTARRNATMINMVSSLFTHQKIETVLARAKEARRLAEKLITIGKENTVAARRRAYQVLKDRDLVGKLFTEIAPLHKNRTSGYTRIIQLGFRRGDGAKMAILELTDKKVIEKKLPSKKKGKEAAVAASEPKKTAKQAAPEEVKKPAEEKKEVKKDEQNIKHIPKSKPSFDDEKRTEKAKSEERKIAGQKGFMKNLRGLFRKRGDR